MGGEVIIDIIVEPPNPNKNGFYLAQQNPGTYWWIDLRNKSFKSFNGALFELMKRRDEGDKSNYKLILVGGSKIAP